LLLDLQKTIKHQPYYKFCDINATKLDNIALFRTKTKKKKMTLKAKNKKFRDQR